MKRMNTDPERIIDIRWKQSVAEAIDESCVCLEIDTVALAFREDVLGLFRSEPLQRPHSTIGDGGSGVGGIHQIDGGLRRDGNNLAWGRVGTCSLSIDTVLQIFRRDVPEPAWEPMAWRNDISARMMIVDRDETYGHSPFSAKFRQTTGGTWTLGWLLIRALSAGFPLAFDLLSRPGLFASCVSSPWENGQFLPFQQPPGLSTYLHNLAIFGKQS
jgi:hypothetical protein